MQYIIRLTVKSGQSWQCLSEPLDINVAVSLPELKEAVSKHLGDTPSPDNIVLAQHVADALELLSDPPFNERTNAENDVFVFSSKTWRMCNGISDPSTSVVDKRQMVAAAASEKFAAEKEDLAFLQLIQLAKESSKQHSEAVIKLKQRAAEFGLKQNKDIDDKGDCQFDAIADQLRRRTKWYHETKDSVRKTVVEWIQAHADDDLGHDTTVKEWLLELPEYKGKSFDDYISSMSRQQTWGDEMTLLAAREAYQVGIIIVSSTVSENGWYQSHVPNGKGDKDELPLLWLGLELDIHYWSLIEAEVHKLDERDDDLRSAIHEIRKKNYDLEKLVQHQGKMLDHVLRLIEPGKRSADAPAAPSSAATRKRQKKKSTPAKLKNDEPIDVNVFDWEQKKIWHGRAQSIEDVRDGVEEKSNTIHEVYSGVLVDRDGRSVSRPEPDLFWLPLARLQSINNIFKVVMIRGLEPMFNDGGEFPFFKEAPVAVFIPDDVECALEYKLRERDKPSHRCSLLVNDNWISVNGEPAKVDIHLQRFKIPNKGTWIVFCLKRPVLKKQNARSWVKMIVTLADASWTRCWTLRRAAADFQRMARSGLSEDIDGLPPEVKKIFIEFVDNMADCDRTIFVKDMGENGARVQEVEERNADEDDEVLNLRRLYMELCRTCKEEPKNLLAWTKRHYVAEINRLERKKKEEQLLSKKRERVSLRQEVIVKATKLDDENFDLYFGKCNGDAICEMEDYNADMMNDSFCFYCDSQPCICN